MGKIKVNPYVEKDIFFCNCARPHHNFMIGEDFDDDWHCPDELYIEVHLSVWQGLFKRIWEAIKFVFKKIPYGCYDVVCLEYDEADRLRKSINKSVNEMKKRKINKQRIAEEKVNNA
jgi:hypothetical protein